VPWAALGTVNQQHYGESRRNAEHNSTAALRPPTAPGSTRSARLRGVDPPPVSRLGPPRVIGSPRPIKPLGAKFRMAVKRHSAAAPRRRRGAPLRIEANHLNVLDHRLAFRLLVTAPVAALHSWRRSRAKSKNVSFFVMKLFVRPEYPLWTSSALGNVEKSQPQLL